MRRVFVIAEAGSCHDGDFGQMVRMIRVAATAGADACKFQWTSAPDTLAARRHAEEYRTAYDRIAFPAAWLATLRQRCDEAKIEFLCTVYLPEDIATVAPLVHRFKIASFEAADQAFRDGHLPYCKPIIVSTGGLDERELRALTGWERDCKRHGHHVTMLHCVSAYPAPLDELNLHVMDMLDGLSDHTANILTGALAAIRGAETIEVHFRLDETRRDNPDYGHSLSPNQLREYIANVRLAEGALGDGVKRVMPSERPWMRYRVKGGQTR